MQYHRSLAFIRIAEYRRHHLEFHIFRANFFIFLVLISIKCIAACECRNRNIVNIVPESIIIDLKMNIILFAQSDLFTKLTNRLTRSNNVNHIRYLYSLRICICRISRCPICMYINTVT